MLLTLLVVYVAMALLSALDVQGHPLNPARWRIDAPRFIVQDHPDGRLKIGERSFRFNSYNQRKILEQAAINLTLGVGMTFVILTGGIDLSVGSLLALSNVIFVQTLLACGAQGPPGVGLLLVGAAACMGAGILCGVANGWLSV